MSTEPIYLDRAIKRQNLRVIIASEYAEIRRFLREAVEGEAEATVVGEAENAAKALALARNLRPNIAVIDVRLPHVVGLDGVPQSRIGGLDMAHTVCEQMPNTRVILVNNLDKNIVPKDVRDSAFTAGFCRERIGTSAPFTLQKLCLEVLPKAPIFANVEFKPRTISKQKGLSITDKFILFGGLSIAGGCLLIITIMLALPGVFLVLAGAATMLLGLMGKLMTRLRTKAA